MKKIQQRYTTEFRAEAVKLVTEQGLSQEAAANRLGAVLTARRDRRSVRLVAAFATLLTIAKTRSTRIGWTFFSSSYPFIKCLALQPSSIAIPFSSSALDSFPGRSAG
jgi:hypothetical protein